MTRVVHLYHNLLQSSSRNLSKKQNTLIKKQTCLSRLSLCRFPLCLWPSAYLFPILLHHLFCICHNLLWLPCIIHLIPTFPFHFVFPTSSIRAWLVFCDRFDDVTCACAAGPYQRMWRQPGDSRIICAVNFEPADVNCVADGHVIWENQFDGVSTYSKDLRWANVAVY